MTAYRPPAADPRIRLKLDANEGRPPSAATLNRAFMGLQGAAHRYATPRRLEAILAEAHGVDPEQVLVAPGGDEAIDRVCRVFLEPGRRMVATTPSFEMIAHSGRSAGATVTTIEWWDGPFPVTAALGIASGAAVLSIVSPNNPTGSTIAPADLIALSRGLPDTLLLVDLAYTEYAKTDLTPLALSLPNAVVIRTFSKFYGLAALRVGYAVGPEPAIRAMRAIGGPYPVAAFSLAAAEACLTQPDPAVVAAAQLVTVERAHLADFLQGRGFICPPSSGNFVLAQHQRAAAIHESLLEHGVSVRRFSAPELHDRLRITLPGNDADYHLLLNAIDAAVG